MGKEEINNFFCLIGDIWNFFLQKCLSSSPLRFMRLLSKSVNLIGCRRGKKGQFSVIFLAIKPTPVTGIVPKAKKYVFFPIEANKFPK